MECLGCAAVYIYCPITAAYMNNRIAVFEPPVVMMMTMIVSFEGWIRSGVRVEV